MIMKQYFISFYYNGTYEGKAFNQHMSDIIAMDLDKISVAEKAQELVKKYEPACKDIKVDVTIIAFNNID